MQPIFHLLPDAPKPVAPYSHAVEAGSFVFVTGQLATDPDDDALPLPDGIEAQTRKVFANLDRVLKGCRLGFGNVVMVRIFLTDFDRDYPGFNAIYAAHFPDGRRPARTTVGVNRLARGGIVEVDMIAVRS
jgi:2-iminobutanoate/2-iminopropanoate deaminase